MNRIAAHFRDLDHEYRRQILHAGLGFMILLFPFIDINILVVIAFLVHMFFRYLPESSIIYGIMDDKTISHNRIVKSRGITGAKDLSISVFILLLISAIFEYTSFSYPLYIIAGAIAIATFGDSAATIMRHKRQLKFYSLIAEEYPERMYQGEMHKHYSVKSSTALLVVGIITAFLASSWIVYWQGANISYNLVFFIAAIGAATGALIESIPSKVNDNFTVPLGAGMIMWLFSIFGFSVPPSQMAGAMIFSLVMGFLAYKAKIADVSAVLSATLIGVLIIVFTNVLWIFLLLTFFILGGASTKYKYRYKKSIGLAQSKGGVRNYDNVFSNSTAALVLAVAYGMYPQFGTFITYAYLGTIATATGDTLASEIGTTSRVKPRMITTLKIVEPGIDGGVTPIGQFVAILGPLTIGILAALFGIVDNIPLAILITTIGGFLGTNIDSLFGATLQKRGILTNSGVNFVSTFLGALISCGLYLLIV
ncbi:MAG: TIGR00297 family protein [Methanosarcinaceae archaeon]|nr:TIGR00297 family protein [Methanosarcinaceae archaeon]